MEDKKNNFDDIILDRGDKSEKIKKVLLRIIALAILFLVVMLVMKLINGGDENEKVQGSIFPSEPIVEEQGNNNNNDLNNVPIVSNEPNSDQFENLRRQLQGEDSQSIDQNITANIDNILPATPVEDSESVIIPDGQSVKETQGVKTTKPEPPVVVVKDPKKNQQASSEQVSTKSTTDPKNLFKNVGAKVPTSDLPSGTYIQIFSVSKFDSKSKELLTIVQNGYDYKPYKTEVNGKELVRVLVGPFTQENITAEMQKIRANIKKDAFVFKIMR